MVTFKELVDLRDNINGPLNLTDVDMKHIVETQPRTFLFMETEFGQSLYDCEVLSFEVYEKDWVIRLNVKKSSLKIPKEMQTDENDKKWRYDVDDE